MLTLFWILLVTGSLTMTKLQLQHTLDRYGAVYVAEINYVAAHSHLPLGQKFKQLKKHQKFEFAGKTCTVMSRKTINYTTGGAALLTGADLYLQTCLKKADLAYLIKAKCDN